MGEAGFVDGVGGDGDQSWPASRLSSWKYVSYADKSRKDIVHLLAILSSGPAVVCLVLTGCLAVPALFHRRVRAHKIVE